MVDELHPDERALIDAVRRARSSDNDLLPRVDAQDLLRRLRTKAGLTGDTPMRTLRLLEHVTGESWMPAARSGRRPAPFEGPRVSVRSTLAVLRASYAQHEEELIARSAGGAVVRHHREVVARYCRALELPWRPEAGMFEQRWRRAAKRRDELVQLPEDFIHKLACLVNDVRFAADDAFNESYRHRVRFCAFVACRVPSECGRVRVQDVHFQRRAVTIWESKTGDGDMVRIPRDVFGLRPTVLTHPARRSVKAYIDRWRPVLGTRGRKANGEGYQPEWLWLNSQGARMDSEEFRTTVSAFGKMELDWPTFHAYNLREVGFIMHALETLDARGHFDLEHEVQWSNHAVVDTLRRYHRKGRSLFRDLGEDKAQLRHMLSEWRSI